MAKVMKAGAGSSDPGDNALEAVIDSTVRQIATKLIGKDHVVFLPKLSRFHTKSILV